MNNEFSPELEKAISDVVEELESNTSVQMYKALAKRIVDDDELNQLWSQKKQIQQELIQAKQYHLIEQQKHLTLALNEVNQKLEKHPLINVYNELYEQISDIQKEIEEIVFSEK